MLPMEAEFGRSLRPLISEQILSRFASPDEVHCTALCRLELVRIAGTTVGRATCQPGWRWSDHIGRSLGQERCNVEQLGLVLQGAGAVEFADGKISVLRAGDVFYVPPEP